MTRSIWRSVGPWATPLVVAVEIGLVAMGRLTVGSAVVVGLGIEALLWVTAISSAIAAVRGYRSARTDGLDRWKAVEDGLARIVPRRVARALLIEPGLFACLVRWVSGRHEGTRSDTFSYHRGIRPLLGAVIGLVVCEGAVVDVLLALLFRGSLWVWVVLGVHLYALVWLAGFYASLVSRPHEFRGDRLVVRDGIFTELEILYTAVRGARIARKSNLGRSGLKVDLASGEGILAIGDANVTIDLDPSQRLETSRTRLLAGLRAMRITVDHPTEFVARLLASREQVVTSPIARLG